MSDAKNLMSLDVLSTVTTARNQNGLRHNSYQRYRIYCTRRVKVIRKNEGLVQHQGKGKGSFTKIDITAVEIKNDRILQLPLVEAERCWAYAMQCKQDAVGHPDEPRKLIHSIKRFKKASQWANKLKELAAKHADDVTGLESDAYASIMDGYVSLEKEEFSSAFTYFSRGSKIYENLGLVSVGSKRELFNNRVNEIKQNLRYCEYNMHPTEKNSINNLRLDRLSGHESELLSTKLEAVLAAARRKEAATSATTIVWRGFSMNVASEVIRLHLLTADQRKEELDALHSDEKTSDEQLDSVYTSIFSACDDASTCLGNELKKIKGSGNTSQIEQFTVLQAYIKEKKTRVLLQRNQNLILKGKLSSPLDSVRIYELIIDNLQELYTNAKLDVAPVLPDELKSISSLIEVYNISKICTIGDAYASNNDWSKACRVYKHALETCSEALKNIAVIKGKNADIELARKNASELNERIRKNNVAAIGQAYLFQTKEENVVLPVAPLPTLPPAFATMPAKPTLFDLAFSSIEHPQWNKRLPGYVNKGDASKPAGITGLFSGWFR